MGAGKAIPIFVAHGTSDTVFPISCSEHFCAKLRQLNCAYRFKPVVRAGHDIKTLDLVLPEIFEFFEGCARNSTPT
jgi:dipeptidyl aminopeptidase/acylaminoacyl peptidase